MSPFASFKFPHCGFVEGSDPVGRKAIFPGYCFPTFRKKVVPISIQGSVV